MNVYQWDAQQHDIQDLGLRCRQTAVEAQLAMLPQCQECILACHAQSALIWSPLQRRCIRQSLLLQSALPLLRARRVMQGSPLTSPHPGVKPHRQLRGLALPGMLCLA